VIHSFNGKREDCPLGWAASTWVSSNFRGGAAATRLEDAGGKRAADREVRGDPGEATAASLQGVRPGSARP
jgi:hypothetical protein